MVQVKLSAFIALILSWSIQAEAFAFQSLKVSSPSSTTTSQLFAKKKKKSSKNDKNQKKGFAWASSFKLKPFEAQATRELVVNALSSFQGRTGQPLLDVGTSTDIPKLLWDAPLAILIVSETTATGMLNNNVPTAGDDESEDDDHDDDGKSVIVKYANKAALETVGLPPDEYERLLTGLDGTAPSDQNGKHVIAINLPTTMTNKLFQNKYTKKMVKCDKENDDDNDITIVDAQRWVIERSSFLGGKFVSTTVGVAYAWNDWMIGDSVVASPGGVRREQPVGMDASSSLQDRIDSQGAAIRELKQGEQGLGNKDPLVMSAVAELLRLKSLLEDEQSK
eukprot:CAMPEP_0172300002 /NCGR_PEP_ID=MMETSP1058-20130122/2179_1 /TAXON_ID=83371 /ORGANISM="Detonula confervacea, Strain CCMP 353" /LENGTH=335 /DNA_ID=CAMNT_0013009649 /DNA_START=24 /DNA_END=1031 /DNA_ORIENTATION=-